MKNDTILVLGDVGASQLAMLRRALPGVETIAGNSAEIFEPAAARASVLFNWSGALPLFRQVFAMCPHLRWVHSRSVGLERTLFPELLDSRVPLTNGIGVFSPSLGEFVLGAILYFAKDFRRMIRNQIAGVWEPFDVLPVASQTVGIVGYGDIGRAVAARVTAMGMTVLAMKRHAPATAGADPMVRTNLYSRAPHRDAFALRLRGCSHAADFGDARNDRRAGVRRHEAYSGGDQRRPRPGDRRAIADQRRSPLAESKARRWTSSIKSRYPRAIRSTSWRTSCSLPIVPTTRRIGWIKPCSCSSTQFERFRNGDSLLNVVDKKLGY